MTEAAMWDMHAQNENKRKRSWQNTSTGKRKITHIESLYFQENKEKYTTIQHSATENRKKKDIKLWPGALATAWLCHERKG